MCEESRKAWAETWNVPLVSLGLLTSVQNGLPVTQLALLQRQPMTRLSAISKPDVRNVGVEQASEKRQQQPNQTSRFVSDYSRGKTPILCLLSSGVKTGSTAGVTCNLGERNPVDLLEGDMHTGSGRRCELFI